MSMFSWFHFSRFDIGIYKSYWVLCVDSPAQKTKQLIELIQPVEWEEIFANYINVTEDHYLEYIKNSEN